MFVIKYRKIFLSIAAIFIIVPIIAVATLGLKPSIEFTGGSFIELHYVDESGATIARPPVEDISQKLGALGYTSAVAQPAGEDSYLIRTRYLSESEKQGILDALAPASGKLVIEQANSVGPTIGAELKHKAVWGLIAIAVAMILFIAFAFRKVSKPVSSWVYGVAAILALVHDVLIPAGFYAIFGYLYGWQVDVLFVMAILGILGISMNDTVVVFDRIRENLERNQNARSDKSFADTVALSIEETFTRSVNTSLTVVLVLISLYFLGAPTTQHFAFALIIGMIFGTYSSIFVASPLLVEYHNWQEKKSA
jgi:preprotein translocase subunit SecF